MRYFLTGRLPEPGPILLVESGSRYLLEGLIPGIRSAYGSDVSIGLVTCYPGLPEGFPPETTRIFRVQDYSGDWRKLVAELKSGGYSTLGVICSGEPIMTKWKWMLAARLPAKVFVLNENGDYFWLDRRHWGSIRHFILFRAGLAEAGAVRTLGRLILFPLTVLYLLLYATFVHVRRTLRRRLA